MEGGPVHSAPHQDHTVKGLKWLGSRGCCGAGSGATIWSRRRTVRSFSSDVRLGERTCRLLVGQTPSRNALEGIKAWCILWSALPSDWNQ